MYDLIGNNIDLKSIMHTNNYSNYKTLQHIRLFASKHQDRNINETNLILLN